MRLYLVQHGQAADKNEDADRPLTEKGRRDVERVGEAMAHLLLQVKAIWHSGKTRALQTAKTLLLHVDAAEGLQQRDGLKPNDDVTDIVRQLTEEASDLMIVGHLPNLDRLASLVLVKDAQSSVVNFQKGGVVCLNREEGRWSVAWMITPEILPP